MTMPDPAMGDSGHVRIVNDCYATIDERCVQHLNKVWPLRGWHFVEPAAGFGDLIKQLEACGAICDYASDLNAYPGADPRIETGVDLMTDPPRDGALVITNPPFSELQDMTRVLLDSCPGFVILLTRASQLHVRGMRQLMRGRLHAVVPLPFRPRWFPVDVERKQNGPRHEYMWLIFRPWSMRQATPVILLEQTP